MVEGSATEPKLGGPYAPPPRPRPPAEVYAELGHALLARARELEAAGRHEPARRRCAAAAQAFRDAIRERPGVGELHLYLAEALEVERRPGEAVREYLEAAQLSFPLAAVAFARAQALLTPQIAARLGDLEGRWPPGELDEQGRAAMHRFLGQSDAYRGDHAGAAEHWRRVLARDPDDVAVRERLGEALLRSGDAAGAAELLATAVTLADESGEDATRASTRLALGRTLMSLKHLGEAKAALERAGSFESRLRPQVELALAQCQLALGQPVEALAAADQALAADDLPQDVRVEANVVRARALTMLDRHEEAAQAAQAALWLAPTHSDAILLRARALLDGGGDPGQAVQLLRVYLQQRSADPEGHRLLVRALRAGDPPPAEVAAALADLARVAPPAERPGLLVELAEARLQAGEPATALEALEDAARRHPGQVRSGHWWRLQGDAHARLERLEEALTSYEHARAAGGDDEALLRHRAELLTRMGQHALAADAWRQVTELTPTDGEAHLQLAEALRRHGDLSGALAAADAAVEQAYAYELEGRAFELKAEVLSALGAADGEVAEALYEAGRRRYWQGQEHNQAAKRLFQRARRLRRDHGPTAWYLADIWLGESFRPGPPYVDAAAIRRARVAWDLGMELAGPPDQEFAWTYLTRAWISDHLSRLLRANGSDERWLAATMLERAVLLDPEDRRYRVTLAYCHRALSNPVTSLRLLEALDEDPSDHSYLDERAAALFNVGKEDEAAQVLEQRLKEQRDPWVEAVLALTHLRRKQFPKALAIVRPLVEEQGDNVWYRQLLAYCHRRLGMVDEALAGYRWVWDRRDDPAYADSLSAIANAGYQLATLGDPPDLAMLAEVTAIFEQLARDSEPRVHEAPEHQSDLGVCQLARGELEAGAGRIRRALGLVRFPHELDDLAEDLADLRERSARWPGHQALAGTLERLEEALEELREELARGPAPSAESELERVFEAGSDAAGWASAGAGAGLARLDLDQGRWHLAARRYRALAGEPGRFPEAAIGLRRAIDPLRDEGDRLLKRHETRRGLRRYRQALGHAAGIAGPGELAELHGRAAFAHLELREDDLAAAELAEAVRDYRQDGTPDPYRALGEVGLLLLDDVGHYWAVDDRLAALAEGRDAALRDGVATLRDVLRGHLMQWFEQGAGDSDLMIPITTPIVLELGEGLVAEDTGPEWSLFKSFIPAMRDGIERELGVTVPGVRVRRGADLGDDGYLIMLDEAAVTRGRTWLGRRYCPGPPGRLVAAGVPLGSTVEVPDPRTGEPGCWVGPESFRAVEDAGLELWAEPLEFAIRHLGAVLRRNLPRFLGVQETEQVLARWEEHREDAPLLADLGADPATRLRLGRVLRALVAEAVPITARHELLEGMRQARLAELPGDAVVRALRLRLRAQLPGNGAGAVRRSLPAEWEELLAAGLRRHDGATALTVPPETLHRLLVDLHGWPESRDPRLVLVTRDPELRPLLRRLVENEFPLLHVLSTEELVPDPGAAADAGPVPTPEGQDA